MSISIESRLYRLNGLTPILGSLPANRNVWATFVASKAADPEQEMDSSAPYEAGGDNLTVFARDRQGQLCVMGYQVKGFFKSALYALRGQVNIAAYKQKVDLMVFVEPRFITLKRDDVPILYEDSINERPLRSDTPKGERIALAASEQVDDPWHIDIEISLMPATETAKSKPITWETIETALDYGAYHGLGQWRNADYGRFTWERIED